MPQRKKNAHAGSRLDKAPPKSLVARITEKLKTRPRPKAAATKPPVS
jgi:hypothetical protein